MEQDPKGDTEASRDQAQRGSRARGARMQQHLNKIRYLDKYLGVRCHGLLDTRAYCPECKSYNVVEQGFEHNHRHHCKDENVTYWISRA